MSENLKTPGNDDRRQVKIVVGPDNVARVSPPAGQLEPLRDYQAFIRAVTPVARPARPGGEAHDPQLSSCSEFPAGIVPRFRDALIARGYEVVVEDTRRFESGFRINEELCRQSEGECREMLRAVVAQPLGLVAFRQWEGLSLSTSQLCLLYPEASVLIVTPQYSARLYQGLLDALGNEVGLVEDLYRSRCRVASRDWLKRWNLGLWHILIVLIYGPGDLTREHYLTITGGAKALRSYIFLPHRLRPGKATQLRLEAVGGPMIAPLELTESELELRMWLSRRRRSSEESP
jgi:hypothetical protein